MLIIFPERPSGIDKAAAGRFIKHAIAQAKQNLDTSNNSKEAGPSYEPSVYVPARVTEKMKEREAYLQHLKDDSESEGQTLEVIGEDSNTGGDVGKNDNNAEQRGKKRRRRPMDPFGREWHLTNFINQNSDENFRQPQAIKAWTSTRRREHLSGVEN